MSTLYSKHTINMIGIFPNFYKLHIDHHPQISQFNSQFEPYSDFNFVSLYSWNIDERAQLSFLNENLVIKLKDYSNDRNIYSFLGNNELNTTINYLFDYLKSEGEEPVLKLIPEMSIKGIMDQKLNIRIKIEEDRDQHDYIFSTEKVATLMNSEYKKKRNLIANLHKKSRVAPYSRILNLASDSDRELMMNLTELWLKNKKIKSKKVNADELSAFRRVLHFAKYDKMFCLGIFADNKLIGFSVNEILNNGYGITHYEKTDQDYIGSGEFLLQQTARELLKKDVYYLNFEQDLGELNLRSTKMLWRPIKFLKKYTISNKIT